MWQMIYVTCVTATDFVPSNYQVIAVCELKGLLTVYRVPGSAIDLLTRAGVYRKVV